MASLSARRIVMVLFVFSLGIACCEAQTKTRGRNPEKSLFGKSINTRQTKVKESRKVIKAKKVQEKKEAKLKKEYNNFVDDSRKRAFKIQSPDVQERMKKDKKEIAARDKAKKKKVNASTKKAARKYKK